MRTIALIALLAFPPAQAADVVPADWGGYGSGWNKEKKPKDPVVPEPAQFGFFLVGASLAWCVLRRAKRD